MVVEVRPDHVSDWAAMRRVAQLLGVHAPETVRKWVHRSRPTPGARPGATTQESTGVERLRRKNVELRRANSMGDHVYPPPAGTGSRSEVARGSGQQGRLP